MGGRFHPVDGESLGGCLIADRVGGRADKAEGSAYTLLRGWEDESGDPEGVSACGRRLGTQIWGREDTGEQQVQRRRALPNIHSVNP